MPLNSPNDLVCAPDGGIYFTDPPYGIPPGAQRQPAQGLYRIEPGRAEPVLLVDDFDRPNGLAASPDWSRLYVSDSSRRRHLRVFRVRPDGGLDRGAEFFSMANAPPGVPDGLAVDREGRIFATGPGGIWILDPRGRHLGTIHLPEAAANCAWGGDDWGSLFITAETGLYRVSTRTVGGPAGWA